MSEFNRTCPSCKSDGTPKGVTAERGTFMVTLDCGQCGIEWTTERKPDTQLFQHWEHVPLHTQ